METSYRRSRVMFRIRTLLVAGVVATSGCQSPTQATYRADDWTSSFQQADFTRFYHVHVPDRPEPGPIAPLVLAFHGVGQNGRDFRALTRLDETAAELGFIVVYLEAAMGAWDVFGELGNLGLDEFGYVRRVIDEVSNRHVIDHDRIIAIGLSNGGVFAQRLGCKMSNRIAGFVSVSATLVKRIADECDGNARVSAFYIAGTDDFQFPVDGNSVLHSLDGAMQFWGSRNGCNGGRSSSQLSDRFDDGTVVFHSRYNGCDAGARVWLDSIVGGGHTWAGSGRPPSEGMGITSAEISANAEIARFLSGLRR